MTAVCFIPGRARACTVTSGSSSTRASLYVTGERAVIRVVEIGRSDYFMNNTTPARNITNVRPQATFHALSMGF